MTSLVFSELLKLRTTRALWAVLGLSAAFAALIPILATVWPRQFGTAPLTSATLAEMLRAPARVTGGAALLLGLLAAAGEFRHGTVLTTRLVEPRSGRALAAKLIALGTAGLALGVIVELVAAAAGVAGLLANGVTVEMLSAGVWRVALTVPVLVALHAILGVAVGSLFRSTTVGVGVVLVWVFVLEGLVPMVTRHPHIADWLPGGTVNQILADQTAPGQLAPVAAGGLLLAYVGVLLAATVILDRRRELQ
jgi:ABC-2 type transport system permease protein